jgi:Zn finger protein HypA/HybF involved in hydrogenase expression
MKMSDNPDRAAIERAAIGPLQRIIDEQDQDLAAMGERVRVLTEALAELLAGVETGHFNTAIDDARSVLASVPFGERFTDCKWAAPSEPKRIESPNPLTPTFVFVPSEPSMKCPTCGSEDRAERLCVKCESIRLGFMARVEHDRLTCPDSFHSVLSEPTVCPTCGSDDPERFDGGCGEDTGQPSGMDIGGHLIYDQPDAFHRLSEETTP